MVAAGLTVPFKCLAFTDNVVLAVNLSAVSRLVRPEYSLTVTFAFRLGTVLGTCYNAKNIY